MGRVGADNAADTAQAELELREQAGRRGANTVLLVADQGAIQGKAYLCHPRKSTWTASQPLEPHTFGTAKGTHGIYGPVVPVIEYSPKEGPNPVQKPN
jgi:chitodextrinase